MQYECTYVYTVLGLSMIYLHNYFQYLYQLLHCRNRIVIDLLSTYTRYTIVVTWFAAATDSGDTC
jgi:hypothetical protein